MCPTGYLERALAFLVIFEIAYVSAVILGGNRHASGWVARPPGTTNSSKCALAFARPSVMRRDPDRGDRRRSDGCGVAVPAHRYTPCRREASGDSKHRAMIRGFRPRRRLPARTNFPDPPGDNPIDLVVLGESSAEGVPFSTWLSIGSILQWKLSLTFPGRPIRGRVLARSGDTLEWQHRELANLPSARIS